jgi:uroporphyrinogen-III decarboxylase
LTDELGLIFPKAHYEPYSLVAMAVAIRKKRKASLTMLPFCCTVEAEALGAKVNLGNSTIGPHPGEFVHHSLAEFMTSNREIDIESGRLAAILKACQILAEEGSKVAVELSGPLSILSCLMDLSIVIKAWRKDEQLMGQTFDYLGDQILKYALALKGAGVTIISYADPVGIPKIIGPKYSRSLAENFLIGFLNKLRIGLQGMTVHLCPNTARLLTDCGLGQWSTLNLKPGLSYQDSCLELSGKVGFLGQACLKRLNYYIHGGEIAELLIPDSVVS